MPSIAAVDGLGTTKTSLVPATTVRGALFYRLSRNPILSFCVTTQFFPRLVSGAQHPFLEHNTLKEIVHLCQRQKFFFIASYPF